MMLVTLYDDVAPLGECVALKATEGTGGATGAEAVDVFVLGTLLATGV
jgi:hypothetical protein